MQKIDYISPQNVSNNRFSELSIELLSRDIYLKNIYQRGMTENSSCDFRSDEIESLKVQSFEILKEPILVSNVHNQAFLDRLNKVRELGFQDIYCDEGQILLFHAEKGGLCALDRLTCSVSAVFLNKNTVTVAKATGIASIRHIIKEHVYPLEDGEGFSYVDLPLISKKDEEDLPKVETAESLLGPLDRDQVLQFEQTGYFLDLDCRWALPIIENSKQKRREAEQNLINQKMNSLPGEVQEFYGYDLEKSSIIVKSRKN